MPYKNREDHERYHREYRAKKDIKEKKKIYNKAYRIINRKKLLDYAKAYYKNYDKTEKGREVRLRANQKQRIVNCEKVLARRKLNHAIEYNRITKKPCRDCGNLKVEGHHPDYSKPLEVIWLCRRCHRIEEGRIKLGNNINNSGNMGNLLENIT